MAALDCGNCDRPDCGNCPLIRGVRHKRPPDTLHFCDAGCIAYTAPMEPQCNMHGLHWQVMTEQEDWE